MTDLFATNNKVQTALEKLFQEHRLVFWYDANAELTHLFDKLELDAVEKLAIENNEFSLKYKLLVEQPKQKFLLYQAKERPEDDANWLLDLLLSNHEFRTEAASLYLQDLEWSHEFKDIVVQHEKFFSSSKRLEALKALNEPDDTKKKKLVKILSVVCGCDMVAWEKILYALFAEALKEKQDKYKDIERFSLAPFLWETIEQKYNYRAATPTIKDFLLQLIQDNFERDMPDGKTRLNKDAYLFVNRWKENTTAAPIFKDWSTQFEKDLNVEATITPLSIEAVLNADTYSVIDKKIIARIKGFIIENTVPNHTLQEWITKRRIKFFHTTYKQLYNALSYAALLLDEIRKADLTIENPKQGFEKYEKQWYKIDFLYRKYIYSSEHPKQPSVLKDLTIQVEKAYSNSFLVKLGDNWQSVTEGMPHWSIDTVLGQKQFYTHWIEPYTKRNNRIFVIISDALRYESATELQEWVLREDKYTTKLHSVLGSLPSYTQLGMASLLPPTSLTFNEETEIVFADGINTKGTDNRTKVLQKKHAGSIAIQAEQFMKMHPKNEGRDFIKPYQVIYIYHNQIDKTGDDKTSESKVFDATESEFSFLLEVIKRIYSLNGTNMIVTSDHGYLYQHNRLEDTDFTDFTPRGKIYKNSRRFILGKDLVQNTAVQKWTGKALGFGDDTESLIPKSINRMRIQGAGSRFVHGGSSLQEIVLPVLEIRNTRKEDLTQVEIDIISGTSNITSNTLGVRFYQKQAVTEKIQARQLKAGFYTVEERNPDNLGKEGKLISNIVNLLFNSTDTDAMAREKRQVFLFTSEASKYNGQDIHLRLEEQYNDTSRLITYKSITYRMAIAFSSEFDDF